jgi:SAM-dependent methyltransferase
MTTGEWWETFFSGLWLDVQRVFKVAQTASEADFIQRVLKLPPGGAVLDVPCGEGRLSLELAARGYRATGVDITKAVLEDARRVAAERRLDVAWQRRDMRDLPWQEAFDGAYCFWGSFGYFDDAGNKAFLAAVARALKPGGRFLIDMRNIAESLLPVFQERDWWQAGEVRVLEERRYDHVRSRIETDWTLIAAGRVESKTGSIRVYTYREICELLAATGFTNFDAYGTLSGEAFKLGRRLYLVAVKADAPAAEPVPVEAQPDQGPS